MKIQILNSLKGKIAQRLVNWRIRKNFLQLHNKEVNLPTSSTAVKNVLILLPLNDDFLDPAMTLIRHLRQYFQHWHFMLLDTRKIPAEKLDRFELPNFDFIEDLNKKNFQLVLDLNFEQDLRIRYLVGSMNIPYRLHLQYSDASIYNMFAQISPENFKNFQHVFNYLKSSFVV